MRWHLCLNNSLFSIFVLSLFRLALAMAQYAPAKELNELETALRQQYRKFLHLLKVPQTKIYTNYPEASPRWLISRPGQQSWNWLPINNSRVQTKGNCRKYSDSKQIKDSTNFYPTTSSKPYRLLTVKNIAPATLFLQALTWKSITPSDTPLTNSSTYYRTKNWGDRQKETLSDMRRCCKD